MAELERVYRADFMRFVRVATAVVGDEEVGADAVHDAFVQAVRNRRSYRGDGPLQAWLWRMVVNAAKKRVPRMEPGELDRAEGHENGFGDPVRAAVAALPERQRLTLFLRYYADLDYDVDRRHSRCRVRNRRCHPERGPRRAAQLTGRRQTSGA